MGSRLWTLAREKDTASVLQRAPEIVREALAWLLEDRVAASVDVAVSSVPVSPGHSMMLIDVGIQRPTGAAASYRYEYNWTSQEARRR
jgi:phage gp46-like protein